MTAQVGSAVWQTHWQLVAADHEQVTLAAVVADLSVWRRVEKLLGVGLVASEHFVALTSAELNELDQHVQVGKKAHHVANIPAAFKRLKNSVTTIRPCALMSQVVSKLAVVVTFSKRRVS